MTKGQKHIVKYMMWQFKMAKADGKATAEYFIQSVKNRIWEQPYLKSFLKEIEAMNN